MKRFALIGAAGYIAPRHMEILSDLGHDLVAACDVHDSVGVLDSKFPATMFFRDPDRFFQWISGDDVDYLIVCTPNDLHVRHSVWGLESGVNVICEKPIAVIPSQVKSLMDAEAATSKQVRGIVQLRYCPEFDWIRTIVQDKPAERLRVDIRYATHRGPWYHTSWKGNSTRSGGLLMNIGVHFVDVCIWMFGPPVYPTTITRSTARSVEGELHLEKADVLFQLTIDGAGGPAYRKFVVHGLPGHRPPYEVSPDFGNLHGAAYYDILRGGGYGPEELLPAVQVVYDAGL